MVDAVHAQGSYIYMQLWQLGRASLPEVLAQPDSPANPGGPYPYVSASDVRMSGRDVSPRPLTHDEILEYIELFGQAAHNAVHRAGFDGVEIHGAHGYLVDQFTQDVSNKRTDIWGGSIENRTRFALEVIKKVTSVVGPERTGIRLSPFSTFQGTCYSSLRSLSIFPCEKKPALQASISPLLYMITSLLLSRYYSCLSRNGKELILFIILN